MKNWVKFGGIFGILVVCLVGFGFWGCEDPQLDKPSEINAQVPNITAQPVNATVTVSRSHNLTVFASVTDGGTLSYQWYSNTSASNEGGTIINEATTTTYNPPTNTIGSFYYFVEITNTISDNGDGGIKTATVRSNAVTLTINDKINAGAPVISTQPTGGTVVLNGSYSLSVTANSPDGGTLTYRWYSNTSASNEGGTQITSNATSRIYIPSTGTSGTFYYFVEITNTITNNGDGGIKTVTIRSNAIALTVSRPVITISMQPTASTNVTVGSINRSLTVSASVTLNATLSYQWYSATNASNNTGGTVISGATNASYTIPTALTAGTYYYFVEVRATNGAVYVRSNVATVIASPPPQATPGLSYTSYLNGYAVTKGTATAADVVIPATYNGLPVVAIGTAGFEYYTAMTSITIPNSVTTIEGLAFADCTGLTSITIGNGVTSISDYYVFANCYGLTSIMVDSGNSIYRSEGNCLIQKSNNTLVLGCKTSVIPYGVKSIGIRAFNGCEGLTSIDIPNSVTSIGEGAFAVCEGLTSITIPASVTSISQYAFTYCYSLTSVTFMGIVSSFHLYAFGDPAYPNDSAYIGDLRAKYSAGGIGTYKRAAESKVWTKQ